MKKTMPLLLLVAMSSASAQPAPKEFPPDAQPVSAQALKTRLEDKVWYSTFSNGAKVRFEWKSNGYLFINAPNFVDSGKWRTEDGKVCFEMKNSGANCSEMRIRGDEVLMKRASNGEVVSLTTN